jgi:hypothetical protein
VTVFICGNSHANALKLPYERIGRNSPEPRLHIFNTVGGFREAEAPFSTTLDDRVWFLLKAPKANLQQAIGKPFFEVGEPEDVWGFFLGHYLYIWRRLFWTHIEPSAICRAGAQPISTATLTAIIESHQCHFRDFLSQLKSIGLRLFVISCPFPRSDHPAITKHGVRPEVIIHIDQAARAAFSDWLTDQGIDLIEPPPECRTAAGFLKPEFRSLARPDGSLDYGHGNDAYGALMLRRIFAYLKTGDQNGGSPTGLKTPHRNTDPVSADRPEETLATFGR